MSNSDWGCKYAEAALKEGFIAGNNTFRPNDSVTQIEALKMIMQAKGIARDENEDWRAGYISKAISENLIQETFNYDYQAERGWIFIIGAKTYDDAPEFTNTETDVMSPEVEEVIDFFLNL